MPPKKKQEKGKKDFKWTDDESELLLNVIYNYKAQQLLLTKSRDNGLTHKCRFCFSVFTQGKCAFSLRKFLRSPLIVSVQMGGLNREESLRFLVENAFV